MTPKNHLSSIIILNKATVYQGKYMALNAVDFQLQIQEHIYLYGATGSGKSSLLQLLLGALPLEQGDGLVLGFNLQDLDANKRAYMRRKIGLVAANYPLLDHLSVEDNLLFVLEITGWTEAAQRLQRAEQLLEWFKLHPVRHRLPSEITKSDHVRAQIARALLNKPELLLLDEPTAALDWQSQQLIAQHIADYHQVSPLALIWATTDPRSIPDTASRWDCFQGQLHKIVK